ncbi:MAG: hypothetical protein COA96_17195 [SAR86 cluster bacterium]|uniref:Glycosyl transferase family 1 domain-containing protein n=1 Tax=SAR86 cluster bacterium TaxID=2030880 RepID=A0A2A5AGB0_9GAMM|nr:MAG: hypothetical protein COA96_17195 [SAR86 cluster bacterium]
MKIIFLSPHFFHKRGGAETNDKNLTAALAEIDAVGSSVGICGISDSDMQIYPISEFVHDFSVSGKYFYNLGLRKTGFFGKLLRNGFEVYAVFRSVPLIRRIKPDVIFLTGRPILALIRFFCKTKIIYSCRGVPSFTVYPLLPLINEVIFWGGCEKSSQLPALFSKGKHFLNAPISETFLSLQPDPAYVSQHNIESQFILTVARLDPVQNLEKIIISLSDTLQKYDLHYYIAGEGALRERLASVAAQYNLRERVHFLGVVDEAGLKELYQECEFYIANPEFTSFGLSLLEAFASGAKIVHPDTGLVFQNIRDYRGVYCLTRELDFSEVLNQSISSEDFTKRSKLALVNTTWRKIAQYVYKSLMRD